MNKTRKNSALRDLMWSAFQFSIGDHIDMIAVGYNISAKNRWFAINPMFIGFDRSEKEPVYYSGRICSGIEMANGIGWRSEYDNLTRSSDYIENQIKKVEMLPHGIIDDCLFHNFDKMEVCRNCGGADNVFYDKQGYEAFWRLFHLEKEDHAKTIKSLISLDFTNFCDKYSILGNLGENKHELNPEYECQTCLRQKARIKEQRANRINEIKSIRAKEREELPTQDDEIDESQPEPQKYLYLMKCNRSGLYKIGISVDPKFREKTLQAESPSIKLVGQWERTSQLEKHWHNYYAKQRRRGEWFALTKCQVAFLCSTMKKPIEQVLEQLTA